MISTGNKIISNKIDKCRVCGSNEIIDVLDLGVHALANSLRANLNEDEYKSPLILCFCKNCEVAQLSENVDPNKMFSTYLWVTGTSKTTREYSYKFYNKTLEVYNKIPNKVLELASNDGTFLIPFKENKSTIFGIDPAKNIAEIANKNNLNTFVDFFNINSFEKYENVIGKVDFVFARNVLAHVPDPMGFIAGMKKFMHNNSLGAFEFHYNQSIIKELHYDSIYHEHYFYYSLKNLIYMLNENDLYPFDILESPINSGNLVVYFKLNKEVFSKNMTKLLNKEESYSISNLNRWINFAKQSIKHKDEFLDIIKNYNNIIGYGSSARSSTFLNFSGINNNKIKFIVDNNPLKQNKYTSGTNIKIIDPSIVKWQDEDTILILAWNFYDEIVDYLKENGFSGNVIKPFPKLKKIKL